MVIADCGLPIPEGVKRIDIALKKGTPSFQEVYEALMYHMVVEQAIVAREMVEENEALYQKKLKTIFQRLKWFHMKNLKNKHAMRKQLFEQMRQHHMPILF
ncbi:RbsD/FucU domain-containing protein [Staphylococcus pseudintermedius]|uniref:RbsD/FucU domain-containing protein n=1 Tax=Staphylococcus pseudintermedius TaxID=283734 RepID=UPI0035B5B12F